MVNTSVRLKPYPAYRPSGVEWLEEIPSHWEVKRLKTFANVQLSNVDKKSEEGQAEVFLCNYVDVYYNERIRLGVDFMSATASEGQMRRFSLRKGDVLITKDSESWTDIAVPAVVAQDLPEVLCGYHLAHIRPDSNCDGAFLSRSFSAIGPRDQFHISANGITRFGLTGDAIRSGEFPLPPLTEQRAIAAFLDRETARIDELVSRKERLIKLLQEKRTALVTRAVTQGLDPNAPMKDSGVEWLREIPAHWEVKRLKFLASMRAGAGILGTEIEDMGDYPVFGGNGIRGYTSSFTHDGEHPLIGRQGALCGVINLASGRFWATEHAVVVDAAENVETDYLTYTLIAMSLNRLAQSAAQPGLNIEVIGNVSAPLPPVPEQRAIAAFLDQETAKLDGLTIKVREAIDRLKELRTALISAAVTGRIDVREAAG